MKTLLFFSLLLLSLGLLAAPARHSPARPATASADTVLINNFLKRIKRTVPKTVAYATYTLTPGTLFRIPPGSIPPDAETANVMINGDDLAWNRTGASIVTSPLRDYRLSMYSDALVLNSEDLKQFRAKCLGNTSTTIMIEYRSSTY